MKCEYSKRECFYTPVATAFSCYLCAVHDAYKQGTADANANRPSGEWIKEVLSMICKVNDYYGYTDSMHMFKVLFDQKYHGWKKEGESE